MIFARKINKIPQFYVIFARKIPEFCPKIARKFFFPGLFFLFWGGGTCPPAPRLLRLWLRSSQLFDCTHFLAVSLTLTFIDWAKKTVQEENTGVFDRF